MNATENTPEQANLVSSEEFRIPSQNMYDLRERLGTLNKRAKRLHCSPITLEELGTERETDEKGIVKIFYRVRVTGETPIVNGWCFIATIQHMLNGNIIRSVPNTVQEGELIAYREVEANCDHCKQYRRRNDTYLLKSNTGEIKQVGKTCLKDFTGHHNPLTIASMAECIIEATEACRDALDESWGEGGRGPRVVDTEYYLSWVHACIRKHGWLSATKAQEEYDMMPTSKQASYAMEDYQKHPDETDAFYHKHDFYKPDDTDQEEAKAALEWIHNDSTDVNNDYMYNLYIACRNEVITYREYGLVASLFAAYNKAMNIKREREAAQNTSEWQGSVGDKLIVKLTVNSVVYSEGQHGTTSIYHLIDEKGNHYTWFSSRDCLDKGETYILKGTVKNLHEYKGIRQTVLTRCKVQ